MKSCPQMWLSKRLLDCFVAVEEPCKLDNVSYKDMQDVVAVHVLTSFDVRLALEQRLYDTK